MINRMIVGYGLSSYLEIGLGNGANYRSIVCENKTGIDVEVSFAAEGIIQIDSDSFFHTNEQTFDFIFVDGLHHAEQAYRDIENALKFINDGGVIMVHDCNPKTKEEQKVPRMQKVWTGDVWKAWVKMRSRPDIYQVCVDDDHGCGVIFGGTQWPFTPDEELIYENLDANRAKWLNLMSWKDFEQMHLTLNGHPVN